MTAHQKVTFLNVMYEMNDGVPPKCHVHPDTGNFVFKADDGSGVAIIDPSSVGGGEMEMEVRNGEIGAFDYGYIGKDGEVSIGLDDLNAEIASVEFKVVGCRFRSPVTNFSDRRILLIPVPPSRPEQPSR